MLRATAMNPLPHKETTLLNENGVVITFKELTVPGKAFKWGDLAYVNITRSGGNPLTKLLGRATFRLMVSTKTNSTSICVLETQDVAFMRQLQIAINQVAKTLGGNRIS